MFRILRTIAVTLSLAVMAGSQAVSPEAMPAALRAHVNDESFGLVTSLRGLPLGVRDALQKLFDSHSLDIAEPWAEFQASEASVNSTLPVRRLVAAGCSSDHCLVYYERGGRARTWRVALFHWTPAATRFDWGAAAPGSLATIDDVKKAVVSGRIKGHAAEW